MCGFLGWFKRSPHPWSEAEKQHAKRVLSGLRHRGPDDESEASGDGWWLGFRRLSILDLSDHARQPMSFGNGRYTLAFNGEIYNYRQLRHRELSSTGDTIVLGSMLETQSVEQVLHHLRGMFAFAWWDRDERHLTVARDHFGIKPLYYRLNENGDLWIGSELRSVQQLAHQPFAMNQQALADYFQRGAVQAPRTLVEGIHCLPPGHLLRWHDGKLNVEPWFVPRWPAEGEWLKGEQDQLEATRNVILDSVKAHLVSDVPVGVFLSGGLDSTLMAACMRHLGMNDVQAFSIGYEGNAGVPDESDTAEQTARYLGCRFTRERLSSDSLFDKLDAYFDRLDQPTTDALNTWLVSQVAAQHVKVTLSGLGADEWFAGYNYHRFVLVAMNSPLRHTPLGQWLQRHSPAIMQNSKPWKGVLYATGAFGHDGLQIQNGSRLLMRQDRLRSLLAKDIDDPMPQAGGGGHWLHELLLAETRGYLANTLLRDNDATSMSHSLELRVPLVDKEVFALAGRLPPASKLTFGMGKRVLRRAFHDLLPPWIAEDTRKKTFTLPLMKWMRTPRWKERIQDTVTSPSAKIHQWIHPEGMKPLLDGYYAHGEDTQLGWNFSQPVWMLFVLENWLQRHSVADLS